MFIILALFIIWLFLHVIFRFILSSQSISTPFLISHRGAKGLAPENTMAGISEAIKHGANFIEIDVRRSFDDVILLMHDKTVDRTTNGSGPVNELTWEELKPLDAGSHFSPKFFNERIPTLKNVLKKVAEKKVNLILEVKDPDLYPRIEKNIVDSLKLAKMKDHVTIISFDHDFLVRVHKIDPEIALGKLGVWFCGINPGLNCKFVDIHWSSVILDPTLIFRAHRSGYKVVVWTVNKVWCMNFLLWLGVDGITTDFPSLGNDLNIM